MSPVEDQEVLVCAPIFIYLFIQAFHPISTNFEHAQAISFRWKSVRNDLKYEYPLVFTWTNTDLTPLELKTFSVHPCLSFYVNR